MDKEIKNAQKLSDEELMELMGGYDSTDGDTTPLPLYGIVVKYGVTPKYGVQPLYGIEPQPLYGIIVKP